MLLQDTPTGAESQAGDGLIFSSFFFFPSFSRAAGGLGDVEDSEAVLFFGGDDESALAALTDGIERVVHDLNADLQQLIGISLNDERLRRKFAAHFYVESLPLRLRELDGGAQQSFEIHGSHCSRALPRETEKAGHQRLGAADMLSNSGREFMLFRVERRGEKKIGIAEHGGDGIVEFVGDATYELSDRGQLFRFCDLGLQALQVVQRLTRVG